MSVAACGVSAVSDLLAEMQAMIDRGGPEPCEYAAMTAWLAEANRLVAQGHATSSQLQQVWRDQGEAFLRGTVQGFALLKPHGYAGDFEIIDRIYTCWSSPNPHLARWDAYAHAQIATRVVRNRKQVFQQILQESLAEKPGSRFRVLNLGSGPCRDVVEFIAAHPEACVTFDCVDQDTNAIAYAASLAGAVRGNATVRFQQSNVLRFRARENYDLIWSSGLFDYVPDRLFVALLSRLASWIRPGGRMVLGNFSPANPSRHYMELVTDWILHYRDKTQLCQLAEQAGIGANRAGILQEPEGVNLFLDIRTARIAHG